MDRRVGLERVRNARCRVPAKPRLPNLRDHDLLLRRSGLEFRNRSATFVRNTITTRLLLLDRERRVVDVGPSCLVKVFFDFLDERRRCRRKDFLGISFVILL